MLKSRVAIQSDLDRLEEWGSRNIQQGQMQTPAPGKQEIPTMIQAGHRVAEELLLCGKGPGGLGR